MLLTERRRTWPTESKSAVLIDEGLTVWCATRSRREPACKPTASGNLWAIVSDSGQRTAPSKTRSPPKTDRPVSWRTQGPALQPKDYTAFLNKIGYLVQAGQEFQITTAKPSLKSRRSRARSWWCPSITPVTHLNAANARWGRLYDVLYGTDVIPQSEGAEKGRGLQSRARREGGRLRGGIFRQGRRPIKRQFLGCQPIFLQVRSVQEATGRDCSRMAKPWVWPRQIHRLSGKAGELTSIVLSNNGLRIEIQIDRGHPIGKAHPAGVKDVILEAATTTIEDCEDCGRRSGRCRQGDGLSPLVRHHERDARGDVRKERPAADPEAQPGQRLHLTPTGRKLTLPGRSLLLVRNVGIHMYTDAVTATMTAGNSRRLSRRNGDSARRYSRSQGRGETSQQQNRAASYIVKPKQHGPEEVAATVELFQRIEAALGLKRKTLKIGIMDEERRTTVNLEGMHPRGEGAGGLHQHRLFGSYRRRDPHRHGAGRDAAQGRDQSAALDQGLRRLERGHRHRNGISRGRRRSARGCGPCRMRCARWSRPRSPIRKRAPTPPGCRRPPRRRCTRCTITTSMSPRGSGNWQARPRASLDHILDAAAVAGPLVGAGGDSARAG